MTLKSAMFCSERFPACVERKGCGIGFAGSARQTSGVLREAAAAFPYKLDVGGLAAYVPRIRILPKAVRADLEYFHQLKATKVTDIAELQSQINGQIYRMNRIIKSEGMKGLKQRILNYTAEVEAEGRAFVKTLAPPKEGMAWLHEPDMRLGGLPTDVWRQGSLRINSILGGQANRLRQAILDLSDDVTKIAGKLTVLPIK